MKVFKSIYTNISNFTCNYWLFLTYFNENEGGLKVHMPIF